jgi:Fungal trichothecene efflux pump (TRI12)
LLGGGFAQNVKWTWIFWINLPVGNLVAWARSNINHVQFIGVAIPLITFFLRLNYRTGAFAEKLRRVDWIGMVLFIASATGFLIPISWGGVMYPWSSWRTLVPLIVCGVGLIAFVVYEEWLSRKGGEPLIRFGPLKTRTGAVTYLGTFLRKSLLALQFRLLLTGQQMACSFGACFTLSLYTSKVGCGLSFYD